MVSKDSVFYFASLVVLMMTILTSIFSFLAVKDMHEEDSRRPKMLSAGALSAVASGGIVIGMILHYFMEGEPVIVKHVVHRRAPLMGSLDIKM